MIEIHSICIHVECLTPLHTENGTKNEEEYERKKAAFISSAELEYGKNITFSIDVLTDILYFHARNIHSDYEPHNYMQAQYHKWKKKVFDGWMILLYIVVALAQASSSSTLTLRQERNANQG